LKLSKRKRIERLENELYQMEKRLGERSLPPKRQHYWVPVIPRVDYMPKLDPTAIIGEPPEHRDWRPYTPSYKPELAERVKVNAYVTIDAGFKQPTRIGARTLVMKRCHIGHDAQIGADCELAPGTTIAGHCEIGNKVRIGVNACLRPYIKVGDGARIGAGAVVVKDVPAGEVWAGNPAKRIK
jgi:UDP-N-acetylglucosamine acyltransferase